MNQFLLFIETHLVTGSKFQVWPWYRLVGSAHRKRTPLHSLSPASLHVPLAYREEGEGDSMQRCHRYWKKHSKPSLDSTVSQQNSGLNRSWVDVHLRPSLPLTGFVTLTGIITRQDTTSWSLQSLQDHVKQMFMKAFCTVGHVFYSSKDHIS